MIETWTPELSELLKQVAGVEQVHDYTNLPGSLQVFPCYVIMPVNGTQTAGKSAPGIALHEVQVTLYTAPTVLPESLSLSVPFIARTRDAIYSAVTLNGNVSYCLPRANGTFYEGPGAITYGDKSHCGIVFHLTVKETEDISVQA